MESRRSAEDFFIVDNSDEHWKAIEYVRQWCEISETIDIAAGYFEIGALLALDGQWQKVDRIRILIGSETSRQTAEIIAEAISRLSSSFDPERVKDPFLEGLESIVQGIVDGKIELRVYTDKKFHAKAYITHGRLEVVGSAALVGSSNFTLPGLTRNIELNVQVTGTPVRELQAWFEEYWNDADEVRPELLDILEKHNRQWTPFEVYAKALRTLTEGVEPGAIEWEKNESVIYPILAPYQREAYQGLKQRAETFGGAFLTDGVGLGKTFVGLMLTEYYASKERLNVLILATKTGEDAVWKPELKRRLPGLTGDFTNVITMAHTDLTTKNGMERVNALAERVDVVIIDEAHNFRNHGKQGDDPENPQSRWWRLEKLCRGKKVFLLTATPINNSLFDFVHEFELFTGLADNHFQSIGVTSVRNHFSALDKSFRTGLTGNENDANSAGVELVDFEDLLHKDRLLGELIVQNSRKYAKESAQREGGAEVLFPVTEMPRAVPYEYNLWFRKLLDEVEEAFKKSQPLFVLPMYYPLAYSLRDDVDGVAENRQKQVVGLIRTTFLKRFESSIASFAGSCLDLTTKVVNWLILQSDSSPAHVQRIEKWLATNLDLLESIHEMFRESMDFVPPGVGFSANNAVETEDDDNDEELLDEYADGRLDPAQFDIPRMLDDAFEDLHQLKNFLDRIHDYGPSMDEKYDRLRDLLTGSKKAKNLGDVWVPGLAEHKVLVFTEYADTARYLEARLRADGVEHVDRLDGARKSDRVAMIERFAPFYNNVDEKRREQLKPLRVLVSTDVLSEVVNLQDAFQIINYDLHWNPVRLMQRIGRVDRRMNAETEAAILKARPKEKKARGHVQIRNFLPPAELTNILSLWSRVSQRVLLISKTLGIPGGRLLNEHDMLDDVKVFNSFKEEWEGQLSPLEALRLHYLTLAAENPGLDEVLDEIPNGAHSAKSGDSSGLFICSIEPIRLVEESGSAHWTLQDGRVQWSLHRPDSSVESGLTTIDSAIRSSHDDPRAEFPDRVVTRNALKAAMKAQHLRMMTEVELPLDAPAPKTICWMEVI